MSKLRQYTQIILFIAGFFLISFGLSLFIYHQLVYETVLQKALEFTKTSATFKAWLKNNPPLDLELYVFNWTNPEEIYNPEIKPNFEEIGPYNVKEVKEKMNYSWHENHTISYRIKKSYFYYPKNNVRNIDDDIITTINAVPLSLAYQAKSLNFFLKKFLAVSMLSLSEFYVKKSARDILFDGYKDGILRVLSNVPGLNVQEKFGIFYGRNDTIGSDVFTMHTKNDEYFGSQITWNYKNQTNIFHNQCNTIRGSAGEFYPLNIKKTKLVLYSPDLCRYAELEFVREETVKGVLGYRFTADNIFDNGTKRPENKCFCKQGECIPSGVLDVSSCRQNSPIFLSFGHFYAADSYYRNKIDGMKPNKTKHEFYIIIEPNAGIVMQIGVSIQMNILLQPVTGFSFYQDVPKVYIPYFYFAQTVHLKDELAATLRIIQCLPDYICYISLTFIAIGLILIIWSLWRMYKTFLMTKKLQQSIHEEVPLNIKNNKT